MNVGDHYRPVNGDHAPGIYRVVGATDGVTLLRVGDADGRRIHTGERRRVDDAALEAEFEAAANPDAGPAPVRALQDAVQGVYWSVRRFLP